MEDQISKNVQRKMWRSILVVGLLTFLVTAYFPFMYTMKFLLDFMPAIIRWQFIMDAYDSYKALERFGYVLSAWLIIPLPLTITSMFGKQLLYTKNKNSIYLVPVLTFFLVFILISICLVLVDYISY